jgi:ABC-type branched-subunit amino acid transport system substrate-binding protein
MRRKIVFTLGAALVVLLAACSSSGRNVALSSSNGSGSVIKLMVIADLETPVQALPQIETGAQAAASKVNAAGGVDGHKIEILSCNTQGNPNVSASCARAAVSDHVAAVVGLLSLTSSSVIPILQAAGIPSIGTTDINPSDHTSPVSYPIDSSAVQLVGEVVAMPGWNVCQHPAMLYDTDIDSAVRAADLMKRLYASLTPAVTAKLVPITTSMTDYTPQIAAALSGGTDCAWTASNSTPMLALIKAVAASGQKVKLANNAATLSGSQLQQLGTTAKDVYISSEFELPGTSAGNQFAAAMRETDSSSSQDQNAESAYASVLIFAATAKSLTSFSGTNVMHALNTATNIDVPVLAPINSFPASGGVAAVPRVTIFTEYAYQWTGSKLIQLSAKPIDVKPYLLKYDFGSQ